MDFEVSYSLDNAEQFWAEVDEIVSVQCSNHESIDNALRNFITFTTNFYEEYLSGEDDVAQCIHRLLQSPLCQTQKDYIRRQMLFGLLQEEEAPTLHLIAAFVLYDGRNHPQTFELLQEENGFPRLIGLIKEQSDGNHPALHRLLLETVYEMSRIQRLTWDDLSSVDDSFVLYLFAVIESLSSDADDPYHYPVIRVLLVLNEQYMVASSRSAPSSSLLTNRVLKAIANHLSTYKTFGENLILLLNRESEASLQLLILKLLYLLFVTNATAEYFYTNDLHVLTDVILRNLLDLPSSDGTNYDNENTGVAQALRHTYLRVLHPLLAFSQLSKPSMGYKKPEIKQVLRILSGEIQGPHFAPVDPTTVRLTKRCMEVDWLCDEPLRPLSAAVDDSLDRTDSGKSSTGMEMAGEGSKEVARRKLGMSAPAGANESELSIAAVAEHIEKPGVLTPSLRARGVSGDDVGGGKG